jgi:hypothetical protein
LEDVYQDGKIDQRKLDPVARMGGPYYARLAEFLYYPAINASNGPNYDATPEVPNGI